jgi:hypothetical protein
MVFAGKRPLISEGQLPHTLWSKVMGSKLGLGSHRPADERRLVEIELMVFRHPHSDGRPHAAKGADQPQADTSFAHWE